MPESVLYPPDLVARAHRHIAADSSAAAASARIVEAAAHWFAHTDDALWSIPYGSTLTRSWMVWSNGHCPACREAVPMYSWLCDAIARPWKLTCPHCAAVFPTNDFAAFHASGLDPSGIFDRKRADRALLFNTDHPDPSDPRHLFGVDDGEGFRADGNTWWFVATYLVYGQWKQRIVDGVCRLADAYVVTGDTGYAHRAGVLLDRVADLYPTYDFGKQGVLYERKAQSGYISNWHDACEEARRLLVAFDQVRPVLLDDVDLARFASEKARQHALRFDKSTPDAVVRHIEKRILRHTLDHPDRTKSNFPRQEILFILAHALLDGLRSPEATRLLDETAALTCAVDGVTGEKGLANYAAGVIQTWALFLAQIGRVAPDIVDRLFEIHPALCRTYRFHIDTWCLERYYPQAGDTGSFGQLWPEYCAIKLTRDVGLDPCPSRFLLDLARRTGDPDFLRILYRANGSTVEGLPRDLFAEDRDRIQSEITTALGKHGDRLAATSIDFTQWHLALMRSGTNENARVVWMDYDTGGRHGHADGLNLGLYAKGLDLAPDFGYPPVHMGGWSGARFDWYKATAAHNTCVVDGRNQEPNVSGHTTMRAFGSRVNAIRVNGAPLYGIPRYERTLVSVDIDHTDFYLVDVFRVTGGADHARFFHSTFGEVTHSGLSLSPTPDYGHGALLRNTRADRDPAPGWQVTWHVDDRRTANTPPRDVHLRLTDLTASAEAHLSEAWIAFEFHRNTTDWIPTLCTRRTGSGAEPLTSTFVSVLDPYEGPPRIRFLRRLAPQDPSGGIASDTHVALEVTLADGRRDILLLADRRSAPSLSLPAEGLSAAADFALLRLSPTGDLEYAALHNGRLDHASRHLASTTLLELPLS